MTAHLTLLNCTNSVQDCACELVAIERSVSVPPYETNGPNLMHILLCRLIPNLDRWPKPSRLACSSEVFATLGATWGFPHWFLKPLMHERPSCTFGSHYKGRVCKLISCFLVADLIIWIRRSISEHPAWFCNNSQQPCLEDNLHICGISRRSQSGVWTA